MRPHFSFPDRLTNDPTHGGETVRGKARALWLLLVICGLPGTEARSQGPAVATEKSSPGLARRLEPIIEKHRGKVAVAVKNLRTGETFLHQPDLVMPTASLIKFPVMMEAYRQAAEGKIDLGRHVTVRKEDKVPGSGILTQHFSDGTSFPLRDAIRLMITYSDNTATNLVLDAIGIGATAATMERMGYPNTKIHAKVFRRDTSVFPERSRQYGLGSTTAREMIRLCEALHHRQLVNTQASEAMLEHLRTCDDHDKFPRFLPHGTKIAFKTGSLADTRTAAGILECPEGPVALCVLSCENEDKRWVPENAGNVLCAEVAREVFAHFQSASDANANGRKAGAPGAQEPSARPGQPARSS
jgi:beta-lactamase class A